MEYQNFCFSDKEEVIKMLNSSNQSERVSAVIGMVNGITEGIWVQNILLRLIHDNDYWVSKTAISSLGDLVRIYKHIDKDLIINELKSIIEPEKVPYVNEVIQDILMH